MLLHYDLYIALTLYLNGFPFAFICSCWTKLIANKESCTSVIVSEWLVEKIE